MRNNGRVKSSWKGENTKDGIILIQQLQSKVGYSNIKIYGRELDSSNRDTGLDESKDDVILYLCGHRDGYDGTATGYMLKSEKFIELTVYILKNYRKAIIQPIKLKTRDLRAIIKFLYSLKEDDLVGEIKNKAEVLKKWTSEFENILRNYSSKIAIFLELYE